MIRSIWANVFIAMLLSAIPWVIVAVLDGPAWASFIVSFLTFIHVREQQRDL